MNLEHFRLTSTQVAITRRSAPVNNMDSASGRAEPATLLNDALLAQAREISALKENWDGEGAPVIEPETVTSALALAYRLRDVISQKAWLTPSPYGGAQVEWHRGRRRLALELVRPDRVHYLKWDSSQGIAEESELSLYDSDAIRALAVWFATDVSR